VSRSKKRRGRGKRERRVRKAALLLVVLVRYFEVCKFEKGVGELSYRILLGDMWSIYVVASDDAVDCSALYSAHQLVLLDIIRDCESINIPVSYLELVCGVHAAEARHINCIRRAGGHEPPTGLERPWTESKEE